MKKSKKALAAPRSAEAVAAVGKVLADWAAAGEPSKLVVTLGHQYTEDGLTWDALKGVDRVRAAALAEAARQTDCHAYLALLTLHESGSAIDHGGYGGGYGRRGRCPPAA